MFGFYKFRIFFFRDSVIFTTVEFVCDQNNRLPKGLDDFLHTENFLLIDKEKHIRGIYNGLNRASIAQLIVDIKSLQKEI